MSLDNFCSCFFVLVPHFVCKIHKSMCLVLTEKKGVLSTKIVCHVLPTLLERGECTSATFCVRGTQFFMKTNSNGGQGSIYQVISATRPSHPSLAVHPQPLFSTRSIRQPLPNFFLFSTAFERFHPGEMPKNKVLWSSLSCTLIHLLMGCWQSNPMMPTSWKLGISCSTSVSETCWICRTKKDFKKHPLM